jgi:hypothetical protein
MPKKKMKWKTKIVLTIKCTDNTGCTSQEAGNTECITTDCELEQFIR